MLGSDEKPCFLIAAGAVCPARLCFVARAFSSTQYLLSLSSCILMAPSCEGASQCNPLAWCRCDWEWALGIIVSNAVSIVACLFLLCSFRRLSSDMKRLTLTWQIFALASTDLIYHIAWVAVIGSDLVLGELEVQDLDRSDLAYAAQMFFLSCPAIVSLCIEVVRRCVNFGSLMHK